MLSTVVLVSWPVIQLVACFQNAFGAHRRRHLVGAVEAEHRLGVEQDLRRELVDRAAQVVGVEALVSR